MNNPNPNCEKECRFQYGCGIITDVYYPPTYDKHGNNLNPDGNVSTGSVSCLVCNKTWNYSTQFGQTSFMEQTDE